MCDAELHACVDTRGDDDKEMALRRACALGRGAARRGDVGIHATLPSAPGRGEGIRGTLWWEGTTGGGRGRIPRSLADFATPARRGVIVKSAR
jgi:hypothetical protein